MLDFHEVTRRNEDILIEIFSTNEPEWDGFSRPDFSKFSVVAHGQKVHRRVCGTIIIPTGPAALRSDYEV